MNIKNAFIKGSAGLLLAAGAAGMAGCDSQSEVASTNLSEAADNFEIERKIVFYNAITNTYLLEVDGKCSIKKGNNEDNEMAVTCKTGPNSFIKDYLGQSNNVGYFMQQVNGVDVNTYNYTVRLNPQIVVPDIVVQGSAKDLKSTVTPRAGVLLQSPQ